MILLPLYMEQLRPYIGKSIIKILVGQRRVGKSYILMAVANEIRRNNPDINIIEINLEDYAFSHIDSADKLHDAIVSRMVEGKEIDFIAEKDNERCYVQVAVNVNDFKTASREFGNLSKIQDNYEKIVVTYRDSTPNTLEGIRQLSLREFLKKKG